MILSTMANAFHRRRYRRPTLKVHIFGSVHAMMTNIPTFDSVKQYLRMPNEGLVNINTVAIYGL
jgi:hypothetical protein